MLRVSNTDLAVHGKTCVEMLEFSGMGRCGEANTGLPPGFVPRSESETLGYFRGPNRGEAKRLRQHLRASLV